MNWETIDTDSERARVHGGWIVRVRQNGAMAICFVPDPMHGWTL